MDQPTPTTRRFWLRRRLWLSVVAVVVVGVVFGTGHKDSKVALSASCGPAPAVAATTPVPTTPSVSDLDLSIPSAPSTPVTAGSLEAASASASTPPSTTPQATTPATADRPFCKPSQTTPGQPITPVDGVDRTGPTATGLSGTALVDGVIKGRKSLIFDAADADSGVWQVEVTLGSAKVVPRRTLDSNHGKCDSVGTAVPAAVIPKDENTEPTTPIGGTTPIAATSATTPPKSSGCKRTVHAKLPVDTKQVANGAQFLTATVWDAAGNSSVVLNDEVTVKNPAAPPAKIKTYTIKSVPNQEDQLAAPTASQTQQDEDSATGAAASTTKKSQATVLDPVTAAAATIAPPSISSDSILGRLEAAMNMLGNAHVPYCWGGGHATSPAVPSSGSYCWIGNPAVRASVPSVVGLDCSSSVSWVLQSVGYPIPTMTSGEFANLGLPGKGQQMTIWANSTHVYMEVEIGGQSYFWGTSSQNFEHGPNWHAPRSGAGFEARHLPGL